MSGLRFLIVLFVLPCFSSQLMAQHRIAFTTSVSGNGNLSTWPDAGKGLVGLDAADSICVARATAAGLANPENFVAWLSDDDDDAWCRIHNLTGERLSNCGEVELPLAAGPWLRTDGLPAAEISPNIDIRAYMPQLVDETGAAVANDRRAWSGTDVAGFGVGANCVNWTSAPAASAGSLPLHTNSWGSNGSSFCTDTDVHLLCVETGTGPALEFPEPQGNIAFLLDGSGTGDLDTWPGAAPGTSGIDAGDSICNSAAEDAGLPWQGSYKAWLSDDSIDARDRFVNDGPWVRTDGLQVAASLADLIDGSLNTAIFLSDTNFYGEGLGVLTGTNADGTANANNCGNWNSTAGNVRAGRSEHTSEGWTDFDEQPCSANFFSMYCLSDGNLDEVHADGFEIIN
jgi:hypothetical protein